MIPTYNIDNLTGGLDIVFKNFMKVSFSITLIILIIWLFITLLVWMFGAKKKSEKSIKFGIKNFIITLILIILVLLVPVLFNLFV